MDLPGYHIHEQLHNGTHTDVFRGTRTSDDHPVILKVLKATDPLPEHIVRFQHEFELLQMLDVAGVIGVHELHHQPRPFIVLEDFGARSLPQLQLAGALPLREFLTLAMQIVEVLGQIHQRHVIHKDINPANIVYNPDTGQLKLIDFGISTVLSRETPTYRSPNQLEGTLPYMAPEQTGRMNRGIDYRADFYSLGVTLYELLTGHRPFHGKDPLELVHNHIAVQPRSPQIVKPDVPPIVAAIILKLMAKTAEERYQSAAGIRADLARCLHHVDSLAALDFPLAQCDRSDRFQIPEKLYGRTYETAVLLAAFARTTGRAIDARQQPTDFPTAPKPSTIHHPSSTSHTQLILVTGPAGIGKSALVRELYRPVTVQHGYFIGGKFDQLQRSAPYFALLQAFQSLMQQILTENEAVIADWRAKLLAALGINGQVIVDVLPDLALIIGPQPPVPKLGLNEGQHRFHLTLQAFINTVAQPDHPLVLYLDDLQWADGASLRLMEQLMTTASPPCLLIIGAYRGNEVDVGHPLALMLARLTQADASVTQVELEPLDLEHVQALIADTLHQPTNRVTELAAMVAEKTYGNPYFVGEFLKSLYADGLITFTAQEVEQLAALDAQDVASNDARGEWQWDMARIREQRVTANVVDLLAGQLHRLPVATQRVLELAACLGSRFTLAELATVHDQARAATATALRPAIIEGHILPLSEHYQLSERDDDEVAGRVQATYRFAHDRVQQAAYAQIAEEDRQTVHRQIGLLLIENLSVEEQEEYLFEIVGQLNRGLALATEDAARRQLADLNLRAGIKAKLATAYESALDYLAIGRGMLPPDSWQSDYELTLALYNEAAETTHANREFDRSDHFADGILQNARAETDKVRAYEVKIVTRISQNEMMAALDVGLEATGRLGFSLVQEPPQLPPIDDLLNLPQMTDPDQLAAMHIMNRMIIAAFVAKPDLLLTLIYTMVNLTVRSGYSQPGAASYAAYATLIIAEMGEIDLGYKLGKLSLKLLDHDDAKLIRGNAQSAFYNCIGHWKEHARETIEDIPNVIQERLEVGNLDQAVYMVVECCLNLALVGEPLDSVHQKQVSYIELVEKLQHEEGIFYAWASSQFVLNLHNVQSDNPQILTGERFDAAELLPILHKTNDYTTLFEVHVLNAWLCLLFKETGDAVAHAQEAEQYAPSARGLFVVGTHNFIYSLALLAAWPMADEATQAEYLAQVAANQERMALWAHHAPMNYQHKFDLVEAERTRVIGERWAAAAHYERAIQGAKEHGYLQDAALANELAAEFFLANDMAIAGQTHLHAAHAAYVRWQARAKVTTLEEAYPQLTPVQVDETQTTSDFISTAGSAPSSTSTSILDAASILKASQTLSSEMNLRQLLVQLMELVMENAGAEMGYLLLHRQARWVIEAEGRVNHSDLKVAVLQAIPVEQVDYLPHAIVNYVARTQQPTVLDDACGDGPFQRDPAIVSRQPKSVLCMPLLNQSKLIGILYLENNLITGAFTPDRLEVLTLLGSQAAISLANAALYTEQQQAEAPRAPHGRVPAVAHRSQQSAPPTHRLGLALSADVGAGGTDYPWRAGGQHHATPRGWSSLFCGRGRLRPGGAIKD